MGFKLNGNSWEIDTFTQFSYKIDKMPEQIFSLDKQLYFSVTARFRFEKAYIRSRKPVVFQQSKILEHATQDSLNINNYLCGKIVLPGEIGGLEDPSNHCH